MTVINMLWNIFTGKCVNKSKVKVILYVCDASRPLMLPYLYTNLGTTGAFVKQVYYTYTCIFTMQYSISNVTQSHSRSAILLLSMIAGAEQDIVKANIKLLVAHGLNQSGEDPGNFCNSVNF